MKKTFGALMQETRQTFVKTQDRTTAKDLSNTCNAISAKIAAKAVTPTERLQLEDYRKRLVKARIEALGMYLIQGGKDESA
jgi:hypothetical protein